MPVKNLSVGDMVHRHLGDGSFFMELEITAITDDRIICGDWKFSRRNGAEIDEELGWDEHHTGTYLKEIVDANKVVVELHNEAEDEQGSQG